MSCSAKLQTNINMIIIPVHGYPRKIQSFFNKKGLILKNFFSNASSNDPYPCGVDGIQGRHLFFSTWSHRKGINTPDR